uniref:Uncharacterized protein n=1 Tax=Lygus hesperus TaxID=30085 RepID=A0A0K8SJB6_LYGHE
MDKGKNPILCDTSSIPTSPGLQKRSKVSGSRRRSSTSSFERLGDETAPKKEVRKEEKKEEKHVGSYGRIRKKFVRKFRKLKKKIKPLCNNLKSVVVFRNSSQRHP